MKPEKTPFEPSDPMRRLIESDSSLIMVLSRFGIPLGFGDKTIGDVCRSQNVDVRTFLSIANFISGRETDSKGIALSPLMSYLRQAHAYFLEFKLPSIRRSLLEAIDCSGADSAAFMILRFFDEYVTEVRKHMEYEENIVFPYADKLLSGWLADDFEIEVFSRKHNHIDAKLNELKNIIVCYYPHKDNVLLCSVLFYIICCEQDLDSHCSVEDDIFIPAVKSVEEELRHRAVRNSWRPQQESERASDSNALSNREKEIVVCIAKGMSSKEMANHLNISVNTVTTHRRNISSKLKIHTSSGLAIYAVINGLITLNDL